MLYAFLFFYFIDMVYLKSYKTKFLLFILAFSFKSAFANLSITEIMQSNFGGVLDYYNEFPDSWVEIYNSDDQDLDIIGYSISKVNNIDSAYTLPTDVFVPAQGYALIYCDKENKREHTDFRLNSDKPGTVYLWDNHGTLVDSLSYPEMISPEVSWGRLPNQPDSLSHFRIPTPEEENNNTNCERVMKKVDFSVEGGAKKASFYLKLSLKEDAPKDAVIRYTTNGSEPTEESPLYNDSIYINRTTVIRAKPFSDSAISKISKTKTYFFDLDDKMPILNIVCDNSYLHGSAIGILSSSSVYGMSHSDNPPKRSWMGYNNYLYNWRRPINVEYYSGDTLGANFNQLSETRVSGNVSRTNVVKSMVIYANKRFGDKHFKGVLWEHLRPNANKQKSLAIRSSIQAGYDKSEAIKDMLSQTAIGRFSKYYDVDFQAQRNVQFCLNGEFQQVMHLQERDDEDMIWANHKVSDIEYVETFTGIYDNWIEEELYPNYMHFKETFESSNSTYEQMAEILDVNAFMNYVSTQAYFANIDFPYNNIAIWYDKQKTKKWRWIMKDLDGVMYDPLYPYYNFLLKVEPYEYFEWANKESACKVYIKMFSLEKFKQPYLDRACVLAGTAFSKNTIHFMLDSLASDVALALDASDMKDFLKGMEDYYEWNKYRQAFYCYHLSDFFQLGDTTQLTIEGLHKDSIIYFNNNPLMENKFEGYFFEGRDLYLTHHGRLDIYGLGFTDTPNITYLDLGEPKPTNDSTATRWTISYRLDGEVFNEHYTNENLHFKIPAGATNVNIIDGYKETGSFSSAPTITSRAPEDLTYMVYSINGSFVGKFDYSGFCDFQQKDDVNIVVVTDATGKKVYTIKLLKE